MKKILSTMLAVLTCAALGAAPATGKAPDHSSQDDWVTSRAKDEVQIRVTVFKPSSASSKNKVPMILHSHGWGGSRSTTGFDDWLDAGFGVLSFDQRGFGESEGQANVQDPTLETEDVKAIIDYVSRLDWVQLDRPGDPVLGAIGGSYGGGYQTMTALDEIADEGRTRFNALSPEITWFDLNESLAPQDVVRTAWTAVLYAAGAQALPQYVHEAFAYGAATGQWPDGKILGQDDPSGVVPDLAKEFHKHGPVYFAERGIKIDVPVMLRQGSSDNLFNLNQGLDIFTQALTPKARQHSLFVGYNGGHALPNVAPRGEPSDAQLGGGVDACSGNWTKLQIRFFSAAFSGKNTSSLLPAQYNLTDVNGTDCHRFDKTRTRTLKPMEDLDPTGNGAMVATAGVGAPIHIPLGRSGDTVVGAPVLSGQAANLVADTRAFFGLAIGSTPADAAVVHNNLMPLRRALPSQEGRFKIELPGVAVTVPDDKQLFLTISPVSDISFGHGSRTPGGFLLTDLKLKLPVL